ncbi:hypothetical protein [Acetobacterium tundrae]|uniref:Uncharacterized protein n=1 Tax=Acetobacterium tundrae TaxID=132932 RepID=A0ABR6WK30_9FIRM|nr:hypothetical protein [Acetobacterium tundrae]MBC3796868.1 hypothetical protein [Acetobacterium tundrae]
MKKRTVIIYFGVAIIVFSIIFYYFFMIKQDNAIKQVTQINDQVTDNIKEKLYKNPYVPNGFKAIDVGENTWSKDDQGYVNWNKGLVIEDILNGNQFVWVPVNQNDVTYNNLKTWGTTEIILTDKDRNQINENGGFYIARYECGVPKEKNEQLENINRSTNDVAGIPVSQKGSRPWNYISFDNAQKNAMTMYNNEDIHSEIISEAFWNITMQWIRNAGYDVDKDSKSFGNYSNTYFSFSGLYSSDYGKSYSFKETGEKEDKNLILATGIVSSHMTNNIYDLAGNLKEFVNGKRAESYGGYYDNTSTGPANSNSGASGANDQQGFRVTLYHNE